jgi:hypothetical protein
MGSKSNKQTKRIAPSVNCGFHPALTLLWAEWAVLKPHSHSTYHGKSVCVAVQQVNHT